MAPPNGSEEARAAGEIERQPLLKGSQTETLSPPATQNHTSAAERRFVGEGVTIRSAVEGSAPRGLLSQADELRAEGSESCCGVEQTMYQVLARLPALHTYGFIAFFTYFGHYWLLMQVPDVAVGIISCFMLYGVIRFWIMWASVFHGINLLKQNDSRSHNYWQRLSRPIGSADFGSIWHAVIVPNYKEPIHKLRQTLDTIAAQSVAKQIVVCMGMEARDPSATDTALQLQSEYADRFGGFCYALHPLAEGEVAGKSSNENWAARCVKMLMVDKMRINPDNILLTVCDADTFFHENHFAYLTHLFLCDGDERFHRVYTSVTNFMPNTKHVPALCATRYTVLSITRIAELACPINNPLPLAIYSLSLKLAVRAAYWDPSVIPEDWHMYFRCVFADQGKVKCTRMFIMTGTEAVEGDGYFATIKETYNQSVRWQWGAIDVGYLLVQFFARWEVPFLKRLSLLYAAYDHHLITTVMMVVLTTAPFLYGNIPVFVDVNFITGQEMLVSLSDVMLGTWLVHFMIHFCFLCFTDNAIRGSLLRNRQHFDVEEHQGLGNVFKWLQLLVHSMLPPTLFPFKITSFCHISVMLGLRQIFPIADIFLFIIPTVHAHTKLFISSSFNYVPSAKMGARPAQNAQIASPA